MSITNHDNLHNNYIPLKIDEEIKGKLEERNSLIILGCKFSGKTALKERIAGTKMPAANDYLIIDSPSTRIDEDYYQEIEQALEQALGETKPLILFLTHIHMDHLSKDCKHKTLSKQLENIETIDLKISEKEIKEVIRAQFVTQPIKGNH
jgi:hypothetical protein